MVAEVVVTGLTVTSETAGGLLSSVTVTFPLVGATISFMGQSLKAPTGVRCVA